MMAVNPPIAANNNPMNSAIASAAVSVSVRATSASARAIPIDTAVTAMIVDRASATVANNSTGRELATDRGDCDSCAVPVWMDISVCANQVSTTGRQHWSGCRRAFVWTLAKLLTNRGDFVKLVKEALSTQAVRAICHTLWQGRNTVADVVSTQQQ